MIRPRLRRRLELGLVFLEVRMPEEIVVPSAARVAGRRRGFELRWSKRSRAQA
jgi:hypothetical protein